MAGKYLRFTDIQARNIANNRVTLNDLIQNHGFPVGMWLSPNRRAWPEEEVDRWLATRPSARTTKPALRGKVKRLAERATANATAE